MVASSLAILFSREKKIVAVDADVDAPNLHLWLGGLQAAGNSPKPGFKTDPKAGLFSLPAAEGWDSVKQLSTNQRPVIDQEKCILCGKCVNICQFDALAVVNNKLKVNRFFCEGCGACSEVCPEGAIHMEPVNNAEIRIKEQTEYGFPLVSAQLKPGETGSGKIVDEIKAKAEKYDYEVLLIDVPAGTGCPVISALKDVDFAVLVTEPTPSGLSDLKRVLEVVKYFEVPFGVVINKWDINIKLSSQIRFDFEDNFLGEISYNKGIFKAISNLTPVLETNLDVVNQIEDVFNNLTARFNETGSDS